MRQVRVVRYRAIADELRGDVLADGVRPGALLPSEAELADRFDASRVTVRKALEVLKADGLVDSRQGFGWYVAGDAVRQGLSSLATVDEVLVGAGRQAHREVLEFGFAAPSPIAAELFGGAEVLSVLRRSLADGQPFDLVHVEVPASLGADLSRSDVSEASFYALLDIEVGRAEQTIGAAVADAQTAAHLEVPSGSPLLVVRRRTFDRVGVPVLVAEHFFPAHLTEFVVELSGPGPAETVGAPSVHLRSRSDETDTSVQTRSGDRR